MRTCCCRASKIRSNKRPLLRHLDALEKDPRKIYGINSRSCSMLSNISRVWHILSGPNPGNLLMEDKMKNVFCAISLMCLTAVPAVADATAPSNILKGAARTLVNPYATAGRILLAPRKISPADHVPEWHYDYPLPQPRVQTFSHGPGMPLTIDQPCCVVMR